MSKKARSTTPPHINAKVAKRALGDLSDTAVDLRALLDTIRIKAASARNAVYLKDMPQFYIAISELEQACAQAAVEVSELDEVLRLFAAGRWQEALARLETELKDE